MNLKRDFYPNGRLPKSFCLLHIITKSLRQTLIFPFLSCVLYFTKIHLGASHTWRCWRLGGQPPTEELLRPKRRLNPTIAAHLLPMLDDADDDADDDAHDDHGAHADDDLDWGNALAKKKNLSCKWQFRDHLVGQLTILTPKWNLNKKINQQLLGIFISYIKPIL